VAKEDGKNASGVEEVPPDHVQNRYCNKSVVKRGMDILGAFVALVALLPVFAATAIAIKLTSPGPVIFRQVRVGKNEVPFVFYKFRSMYNGVDDAIHRQYTENLIKGEVEKINRGSPSKPLFKMASDSRITPVGRFIRRWSIDELPQLINVLKGDMSLVGPRPHMPYEVERYKPWHRERLYAAKPGITGLWQVEGRSVTTFDEMVRLDLRYARTCSLRCDLKIVVKTIPAVFRGRGAV
jgi:lipopolysaccharide/colanic/teichoic acid biosynthesis glycosyltransferase